jgi:hypothetical protein
VRVLAPTRAGSARARAARESLLAHQRTGAPALAALNRLPPPSFPLRSGH